MIEFLNTPLSKKKEFSIKSFIDKDTESRSRQIGEDDWRVEQVVDDEGESFIYTAQWMYGYGNQLQCLNLNTAHTSIDFVSITNICCSVQPEVTEIEYRYD